MWEATASCLGLGFDSFVVCLILGPLVKEQGRRLAMAALFGACDALATFAGSRGAFPDALLLLLMLCLVIAIAGLLLRHRWWLCALPLLLCLDNLATPLPSLDAIPAGLSSFAMAGAGFIVSGFVLRLTRLRPLA